jgi:hypothetical protein
VRGALGRTPGHTGRIAALAVSRDGLLALSAAEDSTARLWDVFPGKERLALGGHSKAVRAVAFSDDGTKALVADAMGLMRLLDVAKGTVLGTVGPQRGVVAVTFSDGGKVVVSTTWSAPRCGTRRAARSSCPAGSRAWPPRSRSPPTASSRWPPTWWTARWCARWPPARRSRPSTARAHRPRVALGRDGSLAAVVTSSSAGSDALELWDTARGRAAARGPGAAGLRGPGPERRRQAPARLGGDGTRASSPPTLKETDRVDLSANAERPTAAVFLPDGCRSCSATTSGPCSTI